MSDKQPDCHTWSFKVLGGGAGAWNKDHVEIRLITPLVAVPEAPLTLGSVCQFSIPSPEQNNREHFIHSVCPHNSSCVQLSPSAEQKFNFGDVQTIVRGPTATHRLILTGLRLVSKNIFLVSFKSVLNQTQ